MNLPKIIDCMSASTEDLRSAIRNRIPISGITLRGTHYGAHNDEIKAAFVLSETLEGRALFPGIQNSAMVAISATQLREGGWNGKQGFFTALNRGVLLLGVGGGLFDEHADRKEKISCTEAVVKYLNLMHSQENRKLYGSLLRYVNYEDNNGDNLIKALNKANPGHRLNKEEADVARILQTGMLAQNLKKGFEQAGNDLDEQRKIVGMAFQFYRNEVRQAQLFIEAEKVYFDTQRNTIPVTIPGQIGKFFVLEMHSDNGLMNKVAHSKWPAAKPEKLAVLFLHKSNGQFVLMPSPCITKEMMQEILCQLRQKVIIKLQRPKVQFHELKRGEIIDSVPEIHFAEATGIISNGAKVDPDVKGLVGTVLSVQEVVEAIKIGLNGNYFPLQLEKDCKNGVCTKYKCPLYNFGLKRCHDVRNKAKQQGQFGALQELKTA